MRDEQTPRTDHPAEGVDQEHLLSPDAELESNELHGSWQVCARCGRVVGPEDDVRRTASGTYQHEFCEPR